MSRVIVDGLLNRSKIEISVPSGKVPYFGVHYRNKYVAQITIDGKRKYLGAFNTAKEAAQKVKEYGN